MARAGDACESKNWLIRSYYVLIGLIMFYSFAGVEFRILVPINDSCVLDGNSQNRHIHLTDA